jgi:hypothetical protein
LNENNVGISVFVFDAALAKEDYRDWISREIEATRKRSRQAKIISFAEMV